MNNFANEEDFLATMRILMPYTFCLGNGVEICLGTNSVMTDMHTKQHLSQLSLSKLPNPRNSRDGTNANS